MHHSFGLIETLHITASYCVDKSCITTKTYVEFFAFLLLFGNKDVCTSIFTKGAKTLGLHTQCVRACVRVCVRACVCACGSSGDMTRLTDPSQL